MAHRDPDHLTRRKTAVFACEPLGFGRSPPFAGVWDAWKDAHGHWLQSNAIVTTEANELMSRIHPRMPVILHARDYDRWLDREESERACRLICFVLSIPRRWRCTKPIQESAT